MTKTKTNILVVFANPRGSSPLRLDSEDHAIHEAIRRSKYRDSIRLTPCHAATVHDLRRALLDDDFRIVHISGHGTGRGLILEDGSGRMYVVPQQALADLFQAYSLPAGPLECVILNSCYSFSQGKLVSLNVPFTIVAEGPIGDNASIEFSRGFYDAIGAGLSIDLAYAQGRHSVKLAAPDSKWDSKLLKKPDTYVIDSPFTDDYNLSQDKSQLKFKNIKALVGFAIDLSGSMTKSIQNNTGEEISRLDSFRQSLGRIVKTAQSSIQQNRKRNIETSIDLFVYGFGLRSNKTEVCDLLHLLETGRQIISEGEIERLKNTNIRELKNRYRGYEGLDDLARNLGLGTLVDETENIFRSRAEAAVRHKTICDIKNLLETKLDTLTDRTLPIEDVAKLWNDSAKILDGTGEFIYGNTPMQEALTMTRERFKRELATRPKDTVSILFLLSDGEPTDGDPRKIAESLKALGITVFSCFVTDQDIANPRILYGKPEAQWNNGAKLMFDMASIVKDDSEYVSFLLNKGWKINPQARLFVQVNHSEVLEEFIRVVLSPLEERNSETLPQGV